MILVTGTYPPEQCGVADYSYCLINSEEGVKTNWKLLYTKDLSFKGFRATLKSIKESGESVVNLQYPSRGYGMSLFPHILCVYLRLFTRKKLVVTIHEFTQLGWKGLLCSYIMLLFANKLIFTNEFERTSAIKKLSCVKSKSTVIRIFSNIPQSANIVKLSERTYDIGCFGYIRPLKGIENFIETVASLKKIYKEPIKAYILGETWPELQEYTTKIRKMADEAGIVMMEGRSDSEVADILADTKIAYLPYPDGLSERRGSFLAFVRNLALIVSTEGPFVTEAQRANLKVVKEDEAAAVLNEIFSLSAEELNEEQDKVEAFVKNELPSSWNEVVEQYNSYINN